VTRLLRTPACHATESLMGYVLRVAEENGYDSPWHVLSLADIAQGEMRTAGFPVRKLAAVLGRESSEYEGIAYQGLNKGAGFKLLKHALGESLASQPLRLRCPAICPDCIDEVGYVDAFWDLSLAVACPCHGRLAVSACPHCGAELTWFRPGQLKCKCGGDLRDGTRMAAEPPLQDLMQVVSASLHREMSPGSTSSSLPTQALLALPFRSLLALIRQLGRVAVAAMGGQHAASDEELARAAADTLSEWPARFHQLLRAIDAKQESPNESSTLRKRFESLYGAMFKGRDDFAFLQEEFIRFGTMKWGDGIVDRRMLGAQPIERRYMSRNELARRTGIDPRTLSKWSRSGKLSIKEISIGKQIRYVADASELAPPLTAKGRMLQARSAARLVGLPVSALAALKASGHFVSRHSPAMKKGYHEADLAAFKIRLLDMVPTVSPAAAELGEWLSLAYVMQEIRFWASDGNGRFIAAFLNGELESIGRSGDGIGDILFKQIDVQEFAKRCRGIAAGNTVSRQEAGDIIGCPQATVPGLIRQGFLDAVLGANRTRVRRESVAAFLERYSSLLSIARELGTTTASLERICRSSGTQMLEIATSDDCTALFVDRTLVDTVKFTWSEKLKKRRRPAIDALNEYLQGLQRMGLPLPRKGNIPNKSAIAAACGLDRSALATDTDAGILLMCFARDDAERFAVSQYRSPEEALQAYIQELKTGGGHLPCRGGRPNKAAIAKACGFKRDLLSSRPELRKILAGMSLEVTGS